jgi:hypothetical protein
MKQRVVQLVDNMKLIKNAGLPNSTWDNAALNEVILQTKTNTIARQVDAVKRGMYDKKRTLSGGNTSVRLWLDTLRNDFQILQFLKRVEKWTRTAPPPTAAASTFPPVTSDQSQDEQNSAFLRHVTRECLDTDLSLKVEAGLKAQGATQATTLEQLEGIISMVQDTHNAGKAANSSLTDLTKTFSVFLDNQNEAKCALCKNPGHLAAACPLTCYRCKMPGHWAKYCPQKPEDRSRCPHCNSTDHWSSQLNGCPNKDSSSSKDKKEDTPGPRCTSCGKRGHFATNCHIPGSKRPAQGGDNSRNTCWNWKKDGTCNRSGCRFLHC